MRRACVLIALAFICACANAEEVVNLENVDPTELSDAPTQEECSRLTDSMPVICKMLGQKGCEDLKSKFSAKCGTKSVELGEEQAPEPQQKVQDLTSDGNDLGASVARRGRGRSVVTTGSFVMTVSNRAGNDEEEDLLGESEDLGDSEDVSADDEWDLTNNGACTDVHEEAWIPTDSQDKTLGKCIQYAADTKCDAQCYHKGVPSTEDEPQAVCAKICRVPGDDGAECNIIKTVAPVMENDKTMYLTRAKITNRARNADPMSCSKLRKW